MGRRPVREVLLLGLLLAGCGLGACRAPDRTPPDVVVLLVGGLRAGSAEAWGYPDRTPGLDGLAEQLYDRAADPQQQTDLAAARPEVVEPLAERLP